MGVANEERIVGMELEQAQHAEVPAVESAEGLVGAYLLRYKGATRDAYACDLRHWDAFLHACDVELLHAHRAHVDAYARACEESGLAPSTVARRLSSMAGLYAYALDEGLLERSPVRVRRPKVSDESPRLGLDKGELGALLEQAAKSGLRDHALVELLALNGLRISEALGADIEDLGTERGHRTLQLRRKGGKRALAALSPRAAAAVDALVGDRQEGPIFTTRTGKRLDRQAAWKTVRRLAAAAGITKAVSPHSFRHGFVTAALDAGVPLRDVQDAAGHADPRTTRRYDRARHNLDRHATYAVASYLAQ
jgi:site-specific recombinase XerD